MAGLGLCNVQPREHKRERRLRVYNAIAVIVVARYVGQKRSRDFSAQFVRNEKTDHNIRVNVTKFSRISTVYVKRLGRIYGEKVIVSTRSLNTPVTKCREHFLNAYKGLNWKFFIDNRRRLLSYSCRVRIAVRS